MTSLADALTAMAQAAYGEDWENLTPLEQAFVRERTLPMLNAALPYLREGIARLVDEHAIARYGEARRHLLHAAGAIRRWPS